MNDYYHRFSVWSHVSWLRSMQCYQEQEWQSIQTNGWLSLLHTYPVFVSSMQYEVVTTYHFLTGTAEQKNLNIFWILLYIAGSTPSLLVKI